MARRISWPIALILGTVVAAGCQTEQPPLLFSVRVEDSGGLTDGQPVLHLGGPVGSVREVLQESNGEATLVVEITPENRGEVYREMRFRIVQHEELGTVLLLEDSGDDRSEIREGDVIDARPDWVERFMQRAGELGRTARETFEDLGATVDQVVRDLEASPEALALRASLEELGRDVQTISQSRLDYFVNEELPRLESRARAYREKLVQEGRTREAEVFWKWYTRWSEAIQEKLKKRGAVEEP